MNRFKFRVWDAYRKRYFTQENHHAGTIDDDMEYQDEVNTVFDCFFNSLFILNGRGGWNEGRFIIQQFTVLPDKNGKDIYEGDIIESAGYRHYDIPPGHIYHNPLNYGNKIEEKDGKPMNFCVGEVRFDFDSWVYFSKKYKCNFRKPFQIGDSYSQEYEIIGNIFENPELITNVQDGQKETVRT
jgi:uncharacterized phage protein (TIGR01671 family)